jgi:hypothetical protein
MLIRGNFRRRSFYFSEWWERATAKNRANKDGELYSPATPQCLIIWQHLLDCRRLQGVFHSPKMQFPISLFDS